MEMSHSVGGILIPAVLILGAATCWAKRTGRADLYERILGGLWAGGWATLAYDICRIPMSLAGIPVFKSISYFGTIITGQSEPNLASEIIGWTYHLSNGIGFGLMYAVAVSMPRWWSAVLWGLFLEAAMLTTPYAEVFGYKIAQQLLAITIGAHVVYGLTLWVALKFWIGKSVITFPASRQIGIWLSTWLLVTIGIGATATHFHLRHSETIPSSPPAYIGSHLYTTWNVLELDRLVAMWLLTRFVDDTTSPPN